MNTNLYKQGEALGMSFLQIPNALFINKKYRKMSIESKLAYGLLLRRMQLSNMNGWVNDDNEVYVIYTREQMAAELCVGYKKSVSAFRELAEYGLISESRRGRGLANHIYISKAEIPESDAAEYTDNLRHVEMTYQGGEGPGPDEDGEEPNIEFTEPCEVLPSQDLSLSHFKTCQNDTSRHVETAVQDMSFSPTSNKDFSYTNSSDIKFSQSVCRRTNSSQLVDNVGEIDGIIENCELESFTPEVAAVFRNAVERMYYSGSLKVGDAVFPQSTVRSYLYLLDHFKVDLAYQKIRQNMSEIRNATAYVTVVLFNCICEEEAEFMLDPFLNQMASYKP